MSFTMPSSMFALLVAALVVGSVAIAQQKTANDGLRSVQEWRSSLVRRASHETKQNLVCPQIWNRTSVIGSDGENGKCDLVKQDMSENWIWGGGPEPTMCLRPYPDFVSDVLHQKKGWPDCRALAYMWKNLKDAPTANACAPFAPCGGDGVKKLFVDIGANIGACTALMLARPDVEHVVAFEPNPTNLFYLSSTVLQNQHSSDKLALFPMGVGSEDQSVTEYAVKGNAGHTVMDIPVGANAQADVLPGKVQIATLDEVLMQGSKPPYVHVLKIDVEGYEVKALKGARRLLEASAINAIQFELSPGFLLGFGSNSAELFTILHTNGFKVYHAVPDIGETAKLPDALSYKDLVHIACEENEIPPRDFWAILDHTSKSLQASQLIKCEGQRR